MLLFLAFSRFDPICFFNISYYWRNSIFCSIYFLNSSDSIINPRLRSSFYCSVGFSDSPNLLNISACLDCTEFISRWWKASARAFWFSYSSWCYFRSFAMGSLFFKQNSSILSKLPSSFDCFSLIFWSSWSKRSSKSFTICLFEWWFIWVKFSVFIYPYSNSSVSLSFSW